VSLTHWPLATPRAVPPDAGSALVLNLRKRGHHRGEAAPNTARRSRSRMSRGSSRTAGVLT
jgi:hypothetical protein